MFKYSFTLLTLILTTSIFAKITPKNSYRSEIRDMTMENHRPIGSYPRARKYLMQDIYLQKDSTGYFLQDVYCNIKFRKNVGPNKMPSDRLINVEHTWPQSKFKGNKGNKKTDLHHLFPTESRTNGKRGNLRFGEVQDERPMNNCPASKYGYTDYSSKPVFEPPHAHKGNVARALFYFSIRYNHNIESNEEATLRKWHLQDPVDSEERKRNSDISQIQGNRNPFIDDPELVDIIDNF